MSSCRREKLDIVFMLDREHQQEMQVAAHSLGRYIKVGGIPDERALQVIIGTMQSLGISEFNENGKKISAESCLKKITKQGKWSRPLEAGGLLFRFGHVVAHKYSFLSIEEADPCSDVSWIDWVKPFLAENSFVQAWVSDIDFDFWQNANDPLQYQAEGRSYLGLPMKSNGLPPPLDQMEIDTSNNPGRWISRLGYIEAVGAVMWLGMPFWREVGVSHKERLFATDWLDLRSFENDILQVTAHEHSFRDAATTEKQKKLRSLLYE